MNREQTRFLKGAKIENKEKTLQEAKNIFEKLKTDPKSLLFSEEKIDKRMLKKVGNRRTVGTTCW